MSNLSEDIEEIEKLKTYTDEQIEKMNIEELKSKFKQIQSIAVDGQNIIKSLNILLRKNKSIVYNYESVVDKLEESISKERIRNLKEKIGGRLHLVTEDSPMYEKINEFKDEGAYNILEKLLEEKYE